jgi:uncharacterized protein YbjT (DUF2867 family)
MSSSPTDNMIGITGATGYVGGHVAAQLAQRGLRQRLIVRDLSRAPQLPGAEVAYASDLGDADGMKQALRGVHTLFLVSGDLDPNRKQKHATAVEAALAAGVERIVYLSFLNAAPDATFTLVREHYATEQHIRDSGIAYTFLRSSLYAESATRYPGPDGVIRGPAGNGRVSYVTRDDVVDSAVAVLSSGGHDGQTYSNTGPEALTLSETAALLTEITGRQCSYYEETMEEARQSRAVYGAPESTVEAWISTYTAIANGELSTVTDDIPRVTGHPAHTLRDFLLRNPESYQHLVQGA